MSPLVGVVAMLAITVCLAGVLAVGLGPMSVGDPSPTASFEIAVDGDTGEIRLTHLAGESLDVDRLTIRVTVDGRPLEDQPPVPFFSADGFVSGPEGPINSASNATWSVGETASFRVASTNAPTIETGDRVGVTVATGDRTIADVETRAS